MTNNKNKSLTILLKRKVKLTRYPVVARATFQRERWDLVSLLDAMQRNAKQMPSRLKTYLQREALWDEGTNALTDKGLEVKNTSLFEATERGLYHIWYTDKDLLLGTRPVLMQRDTAIFEPNTKMWLKGSDAARSQFKVNETLQVEVLEEIYKGQTSEQNKCTLLLEKLEPEVICSGNKHAEAELTWHFGLTDSLIRVSGQVDVLEFNKKNENSRPEDLEMFTTEFEEYLPQIMGSISKEFDAHWVEQDQYMAVKLEHIQQYTGAVANFMIGSHQFNHLETSFGQFDSLQIQHLPIKPIDKSDAELWHRHFLADLYNRAYHSTEQSRQQQAQWLDHPALADFELPLKDASNLLDSLVRELHPQAFWHVAAMADLTPSKSKKLRLPVSLVNGDALLLKELIYQLSGGESVEQMIYSDRYVHTQKQSRNLSMVAACVSEAEGLLLTFDAQKGSEAKLPVNWERTILQKQHDNHGRYWIFIGASHIYCWECSSGLDFIQDAEGGFVVAGTPGFTPKEEHELPRFLQDAVRKMKSEEAV